MRTVTVRKVESIELGPRLELLETTTWWEIEGEEPPVRYWTEGQVMSAVQVELAVAAKIRERQAQEAQDEAR